MNILIVEDNPDTRTVLAEVLRNRGHWVCWAATGEAALEKLRLERIDVMLLDLELGGGMNGWDVASRKMREPVMAHVPIIITSGISSEEIHSHNEAKHPLAGAMLILGKPIDLALLDRALATIDGVAKPRATEG
jgi:CheY-like chemotaxis protein